MPGKEARGDTSGRVPCKHRGMALDMVSPAEDQLIREERLALADLQTALAGIAEGDEPRERIAQALRQLDDLFLLVVVGEFNAGKSAFINALIGRPILEEGVTPTTSQIHLIRDGPELAVEQTAPGLRTVNAPVEMLRDIHLVDTPGTNAVMREHEALTTDFVPRADLVLFVTSADRPFTESERQFLSHIREWGKKIVCVINKVDILANETEVGQVSAFVADQAARLLGIRPDVWAVSARAAQRAGSGEPDQRAASGFDALERYLADTLDAPGRLQLKLLNPLGIGLRLTEDYLSRTRGRLDLLAGDVRMLDDVDRELEQYAGDTRRGVLLRMAEIDNELLEMEKRGHAFFEETIRIGRVVDLLNRARVQEQFGRQVVGDTPASIERKVNELIDWLVEVELREWQAITNRLAERRRQHRDRLVGDAESSGFQSERARLMAGVGAHVQRVVETYDRNAESRALAEGARNAVATAAAAGAGAVGLGTIVTAAATTAAADVTGLVMAGLVGALAFFVIPARRRRAKVELQDKVTAMRERLSASIRGEFEREVTRSVERMRDSFAPYARFVRGEREKLAAAAATLQELSARMGNLRGRVEQLTGGKARRLG